MLVHHHLFWLKNAPAPERDSLSLHDALPICAGLADWPDDPSTHPGERGVAGAGRGGAGQFLWDPGGEDRKSTRLNSSHVAISYAVSCLKKIKRGCWLVLHQYVALYIHLQHLR